MSDLEARVRRVENEQSAHRVTLEHINQTLSDVRILLQASVELQQKQLAHSEAIERAFHAIEDTEDRLDVLEGYANVVRGVLWVTNIVWAVAIVGIGFYLQLGGV